MRILHISETDVAGGRFTGFYTNRLIEPLGHSAEMAVWTKTSDAPHVTAFGGACRTWPERILWRLDHALGLDGFSGTAGPKVFASDAFRRCDVVNLHLIHEYTRFSPLDLGPLSNLKPTVWTIHDCWAFTGMCLHPFECRGWTAGCLRWCPHRRPGSILAHLTPALLWRWKRRAYRQADVHLIAASEWMMKRIAESPLLRRFPCHQVPFGVDLAQFNPADKEGSRLRLGIAPDEHVVCFRGVRFARDLYKGMRWLFEALTLMALRRPTRLLIIDEGEDFAPLKDKYRTTNLGWVDGDRLADAFRAADVFVMPSIAEAFGLMAVEAMACGTPVVVFEGTALPSVIRAPEGGIAVESRNATALAKAVSAFLDDPEIRRSVGSSARRLAEQEYSEALYVSRTLKVYEAAIRAYQTRRPHAVP